MDNHSMKIPPMACRENSRRAMSLLELAIVVAILALLSVAAVTRYGHDSLGNGGAEGFARKLAYSLEYARRCTISTGENHYIKFISSGGSIASYAIVNRTSGVEVDETRSLPESVTVVSGDSELEFDFEGSALGAYSITVAGPDRSWSVTVVLLTGSVQVTEIP